MPVHSDRLFAGILLPPMLIDGVRQFGEPSAILERFQNIHRRKKFGAVLGRIAKRLENLRLSAIEDIPVSIAIRIHE